MGNLADFSSQGYQVEPELGQNRAGGRVTYLATSTKTQQHVVIKQFQFAQSGASWSDDDASGLTQLARHLGAPTRGLPLQNAMCISFA
ncbi:hypothetical protein [Coleofasciculus sp. H7-2]|uniref:hypothetical protein n=1 Tax=Coleofasciculus sp. H7-2 TaxID=3351545 RepID=UPI00366A61AC